MNRMHESQRLNHHIVILCSSLDYRTPSSFSKVCFLDNLSANFIR